MLLAFSLQGSMGRVEDRQQNLSATLRIPKANLPKAAVGSNLAQRAQNPKALSPTAPIPETHKKQPEL